MSTQIENSVQSGPSNKVAAYVNRQLEVARRQVKSTDLIGGFLTLLVISIGFLLLAAVWDGWISPLSEAGRWFCLSILLASCLGYSIFQILPLFLKKINPDYAARMIEQSQSGFKNSLLNYVALRRRSEEVNPAVFQAITRQAAENLKTVPADATVDRSKLITLGFVLVGLTLFTVGYKVLSPKDPLQSFARVLIPSAKIGQPARVSISDINPGDVQVFFGDHVEVSAVVRGQHLPTDVYLVVSTEDGQLLNQRIPMEPESVPNRYRAQLGKYSAGLQHSLIYRIEALDGVSPNFEITVQPNPTMAIETLTLIPPKYTKLPKQSQVGQGEINALEGTKIVAEAIANMSIKEAFLDLLQVIEQPADDSLKPRFRTIESIPMDVDGLKARASFWALLDKTRERSQASHYQLRFTSTNGDRNQKPNTYPIKVTPDLAPEIKILAPRDTQIEIAEDATLAIDFEANDLDFEISEVRFNLNHQGNLLTQEQLPSQPIQGLQRVKGRHLLQPRQLGLKAGDTALFFLTAADNRTVPADENRSDPNITRSENFTLTITKPAGKPQSQPNRQGANDPQQNRPKPDSQDGNDPPDEPQDPSQKNEQQGDSAKEKAGSGDPKEGQENRPESETEEPQASPNTQSPDQNNESGDPDGGNSSSGDSQGGEPQDGHAQDGEPQGGDAQSGGSEQQENNDSQGDGSESQQQGSESGSKSGDGSKQASQAQNGEQRGNQGNNQSSDNNQSQSNSESMNSGSQSRNDSGQSGSQDNPAGSPQGNSANQNNSSSNPSGNAQNQSAAQNPSDSQAAGDGSETQDENLSQGQQSKPLDKNASQGEQMRRLERLLNESPSNEDQSPNDQQPDEQKSDEQKSPGQQPDGQQSNSSQPNGQKTDGQKSDGQKSDGQKSDAQQSDGQEPDGQQSDGQKSDGQKSDEEKSDGQQSNGQQPGGQKPDGQKSEGQQDDGQQSDGQQSDGQQSDGQKSDGEKSDGGQQSGGQKPDGQQPDGQKSEGQQDDGQQSDGQQSDGQKSDGQQSNGQQSNGQQSGGQKPDGQKSEGQQDDGQQPDGQQSDGEKSDGQQSNGQQSGGQKPDGQKSEGQQDDGQQSDGQQSDGQKSDGEKSDGQQSNGQKSGGQKPDGQKSEGQQDDGQQPDGQQSDGQQSDGEKSDGQQSNGQKPDGQKSEGREDDGQQSDAQQTDGQKSGGQQPDGQSGDGQKSGGQPSNKTQKDGQSSGGSQDAKVTEGEQGSGNPDENSDGQNLSSKRGNSSTGGQGGGKTFDLERDKLNVDHAKQATDLILKKLNDQKYNPDPKLLEQMNWTQDDLNQFLSRWNEMKQAAEKGDSLAKHRYDQLLRSLDYRPSSEKRTVRQSKDDTSGLSQDSAVIQPPPEFAPDFNATLRDLNRND
jgi:hypothetical protein